MRTNPGLGLEKAHPKWAAVREGWEMLKRKQVRNMCCNLGMKLDVRWTSIHRSAFGPGEWDRMGVVAGRIKYDATMAQG